MKITVNSAADFIENISIDSNCVVGQEIWFRVDRGIDADGSEAVQVSLTCIVKRQDFDHILEFQRIVGYDIDLGPDETDEGSRAANEVHETIATHCEMLGLRLRKGRVEF